MILLTSLDSALTRTILRKFFRICTGKKISRRTIPLGPLLTWHCCGSSDFAAFKGRSQPRVSAAGAASLRVPTEANPSGGPQPRGCLLSPDCDTRRVDLTWLRRNAFCLGASFGPRSVPVQPQPHCHHNQGGTNHFGQKHFPVRRISRRQH